jgi:hypothetical protein
MLRNSEFSSDAARTLAARLSSEAAGPKQRIDLAYRLILSRPPDAQELSLGLEFLLTEADGDEIAALGHYCLALLNTNEAIYID